MAAIGMAPMSMVAEVVLNRVKAALLAASIAAAMSTTPPTAATASSQP